MSIDPERMFTFEHVISFAVCILVETLNSLQGSEEKLTHHAQFIGSQNTCESIANSQSL